MASPASSPRNPPRDSPRQPQHYATLSETELDDLSDPSSRVHSVAEMPCLSGQRNRVMSDSPSLTDFYNDTGYRGRDPMLIKEKKAAIVKTRSFSSSQSLQPFDSKLARNFKSKSQLYKNLMDNFFRWLCSAVLITMIFVVLKVYEDKGNRRSTEKRWFNAIVTGLQILLSMNYIAALKDLAKLLRWRALAEKPHSARQVDLILDSASMASLLKLALIYVKEFWSESGAGTGLGLLVRKLPLYSWFFPHANYDIAYVQDQCPRSALASNPSGKRRSLSGPLSGLMKVGVWMLVNIAAQIGIATIGLTYSMDAGDPLDPAPNARDGVYGPIVTDFRPLFEGTKARDWHSVEAAANTMGQIGTTYNATPIATFDDPASYHFDANTYFQVQDTGYYMYRYFSYADDVNVGIAQSLPTDRYIYTRSDNCQSMAVLDGGSGTSHEITYQVDESHNKTMGIDLVGAGTTTYIYPADEDSRCEGNHPRCARLYAFQAELKDDDGEQYPASMFRCNIYTEHVQNADKSVHEQHISDATARNASAAIALSGYGTTYEVWTSNHTATYYQFQRYTSDSWWTLKGRTAQNAGDQMAEFAIAALAAQANLNPRIEMWGPQIVQGIELNVEWKWIRILFPLLGGLHFVFFILAVFAANPYVVRDDSNLVRAQFLRPILEGLGEADRGSFLNGKDIAQLVDDEVLDGRKVFVSASRVFKGPTEEQNRYILRLKSENIRSSVISAFGGMRQYDGVYE